MILKLKSLSLKDPLLLFVSVSSFTVSYLLMASTFSYQDHQFIIDSKLWSDFAAHLPLIRSFSKGANIPPQYPTFPGEPIRYHYLFYALAGLLEGFGFNFAFALNLLSALGLSLLLILIFILGRKFFSASAGLLAILLFLFNGTLTFIGFFQKHPLSSHTLNDIVTATQFTHFGPWDDSLISAFWNLKIYTNQRHLGLGFALLLLILYPLLRWLIKPRQQLTYHPFLLILPLILPLIHQAAFVSWLIIAFLLLLLYPRSLSQTKRYLPLLFVSLPGILYLYLGGGSGSLTWSVGYLAPAKTLLGILHYWLFNLGLYLCLLPLLFFWLKPPLRKLLLSFTSLFILANLFRFSPDMINNHKLINIFMILVNIFTAGFLVSLWRRSFIFKLIVPVYVFLLTFSGFIDLFPILNDYSLTLDDIPRSATASWILHHTHPQSTFLTTTYLYNPASLAGRYTWLDYGYFNWSLGYNDAVRKQQLPAIFSPTINKPEVCRFLTNARINYLLINSGKSDLPDVDPHQSTIVTQSHPTYQDDHYSIYQVDQICP